MIGILHIYGTLHDTNPMYIFAEKFSKAEK